MEKIPKNAISYEMAKSLKKIGFTENTLNELCLFSEKTPDFLYNQVIDWFRKKEYKGEIVFDDKNEQKFSYTIFTKDGIKLHSGLFYTDLEAKKELINDLICLYKLDEKR